MSIAASTTAPVSAATKASPWVLAAALLGALLVLLGPTLWNGYPLFYYDSGDYVSTIYDWQQRVYRTLPYSVFAGALARLTGTLWAVPLAQGIITVWVLWEFLKRFSPWPAERLLVPITGLLTVATGLPWFTGQLMADSVTGVVVLAFLLLSFGGLGWRRQVALGLLLVLSIPLHSTHVAVTVGLWVSLGLGRWLLRRRWPAFRPALLAPGLAVVLGIGAIAAVHKVTVGRAFITQPTAVLMLGRLVQDGIAKRFLDDHCPADENRYRMCPLRHTLPELSWQFLWSYKPFRDIGGWESKEIQKEAAEILSLSLREYPWLHVKAALQLTWEQLLMIDTGDGLVNQYDFLAEPIRTYYPHEYQAFLAARQQQNDIPVDRLNALHLPILFAAQLLLLPMTWLAWRRRELLPFALGAVLILAILGNAFVCGALSNPCMRYQSRIVWLAVLAVASMGRWWAEGRQGGAAIPSAYSNRSYR